MKKSSALLMGFISIICTLSLQAQKGKVQNDTAYYETFPNKLNVRIYLSQKYVHLNFPSGTKLEDLEYKANPLLALGAGISYRNFSLNLFNGFSFLNKNNKPKGKTKGLDLQVHIYPRKWAIDLLGVLPKGFHLEPKGVAGAAPGTYYYRPDLKTSFIGVFAYRVPNKEKFSYRAALLQTEWQKKSAGSFLYGGQIYHGTIKGDSALVPELLSNSYPQHDLTQINVFSFGPGAGYAYTLVADKHFFITGSAVINLGVNFIQEEGAQKNNKVSFNPSEVFKAALGYNSSTWNVSANWTGNGFWVKGSSSNEAYFVPAGNIRLVVAHKFTLHNRHS